MYIMVNNYKINTKDEYFLPIVKEEVKNALFDTVIKMVKKDRVLRKLLKTHDYFKDKILTEFAKECCDFTKLNYLIEEMTNRYIKFLEEWGNLYSRYLKIEPIPPYLWVKNNFEGYTLLHSAIPDLDTFICWCKKNHIDVISDKEEVTKTFLSNEDDFDIEF